MIDRQEIAATLRQILAEDTDVHITELDEALSLRDGLRLDSVDLVGVVMRIEEHYRIRLGHEELTTADTVGKLLDLVASKLPAASKAA